LKVSKPESVGVAMMISWYDKRVMSAIMIGMTFSTLAIIIVAFIIESPPMRKTSEVSEKEFARIELKADEPPMTVMRETFLVQTNGRGSEMLWVEYVKKSRVLPCDGDCPEGVKSILIVPMIRIDLPNSDHQGPENKNPSYSRTTCQRKIPEMIKILMG